MALVDATGRSLVHPFANSRDSFINFTEGEPVAFAAGFTDVNGAVSVDISGLAPASSATIIFRLVNNDQDENTYPVLNRQYRPSRLSAPMDFHPQPAKRK